MIGRIVVKVVPGRTARFVGRVKMPNVLLTTMHLGGGLVGSACVHVG
jgi:hypothetical protein